MGLFILEKEGEKERKRERRTNSCKYSIIIWRKKTCDPPCAEAAHCTLHYKWINVKLKMWNSTGYFDTLHFSVVRAWNMSNTKTQRSWRRKRCFFFLLLPSFISEFNYLLSLAQYCGLVFGAVHSLSRMCCAVADLSQSMTTVEWL